MRRLSTAFLAGVCLLMFATPVFAQSEGETRSFFEMFFISGDALGNGIIWFLLLMSAVNLGYAVHMLIKYRKATMIPDLTYAQLEEMLEAKRYRDAIDFAANDPSYLAQLVDAGLNEASNGYSAMERAVEEVGDQETTKMLRPVEFLNVIGNVAPMLGLFGTVYGMILAFSQLVASGGKPNPAELADGISTALVTTFWGLVVAIPALTFYALVRNKIDALTAEGMVMAEELIRPFKPGAKKPGPGGAPSGARPAPGKPSPSGASAPPKPMPKPAGA